MALTSVGLDAPFSLRVTLAQDYLASRVSMADGITLGLTISFGGLFTPLQLRAPADHMTVRLPHGPGA
ncbi:hypothetical protein [Streptomyces sp. CA-146814]|uniref:hypothetical protein n=1 Tax=Streptomyces sp. CA-146814 TaxID=3240053 RepID=UPI003D8D4671